MRRTFLRKFCVLYHSSSQNIFRYLVKLRGARWKDGTVSLEAGMCSLRPVTSAQLNYVGSGIGALAQILSKNPGLIGDEQMSSGMMYSSIESIDSCSYLFGGLD